jgi:hypothetical protein
VSLAVRVTPVQARRQTPQLTSPRSRYGWVVLRWALRWLAASRCCTSSNCSAATNAGTGTVIHSWLGCARVLWPLPIGSSADLRRRAGAVRSRPLAAWPL